MAGWEQFLRSVKGSVRSKLPAGWVDPLRRAASSKRVARGIIHSLAAASPHIPILGLPRMGAELARAGVFKKTPVGIAKGTGAAFLGASALASGILAGKAAIVGAPVLAAKLGAALKSKPAQLVKRGIGQEAKREVLREVRKVTHPRKRRGKASRPGWIREAAGKRPRAPKKPRPERVAAVKAPRRKSTKPPSAKQLAARQRFAAMSRARAKARRTGGVA